MATAPVTTYRFSVDEYHKMAEAGILHEDDRIELIEGKIVEMTPVGSRHVACVNRLNQLFSLSLGERVVISVQNPLRIADSEPEPDIVLLEPREHFYAEQLPGPDDALLVVEVADSSLAYDREVKIPLYARAGIQEVWLVDLSNDEVVVYLEPSARGYGRVQTYRAGDDVPASSLDLSVRVNDALLLGDSLT